MTLLSQRSYWLLPFLLGLGLVVGSGCDSGGSKRESQSQRLSGTWDVDCLRVDNLSCRQNARLEIEAGSEVKSYRLIRETEEDTTIIRGELDVLSSRRIAMTGDAFPDGLLWIFDFEEPNDLDTSVRFTLESASRESLRGFLDVFGISGGARSVEMDLSTS